MDQDASSLPEVRLLLVEDVKSLRLLYQMELDEMLPEACAGVCRVTTVVVEDGAQALARLREERFDVLITGIRMPGMNGFGLLGKALSFDRTLRTGIYSACPGHGDDFMMWSADFYLVKSVDLQPLVRKIAEIARELVS